MSISTNTQPDFTSARREAFHILDESMRQELRPWLIVGSSSVATREQRALAIAGKGFGSSVTTLDSWARELWELHGDGRTIVEDSARLMILWELLQNSDDSLLHSAGTANLLSRCAQQALPLVNYSMQSGSAQLSESEQAATKILCAYRSAIAERNLIEPSQIYHELALRSDILSLYAPVLLEIELCDLTYLQQAFLDAVGAHLVLNDMRAPSKSRRSDELSCFLQTVFRRQHDAARVVPKGSVCVAASMGPTASTYQIMDAIKDAVAKATAAATDTVTAIGAATATDAVAAIGAARALEENGDARAAADGGASAAPVAGTYKVVVASKDPVSLFNNIAAPLLGDGISCSVSATTPFACTDMGRALVDLSDLHDNANIDVLEATDFSYNQFSGMSRISTFRLDKMRRNNRLIDAEEVLCDLAGHAAEGLKGVIGLLDIRDFDGALDCLQAYAIRRFAKEPAYLQQQLRALHIARDICTQPGMESLSFSQAIALIEDAAVSIAQQSAPNPHVLITTLRESATLEPSSVNCAIICDMNAKDYPVASPDDSLTTLLEKWGARVAQDPLRELRHSFFRTVESATDSIVLQRLVNDEVADPAAPAALFEEAMDCYRASITDTADMDRALLVPKCLLAYTTTRGEQHLLENVSLGALVKSTETFDFPQVGAVSDDAKPIIVAPRRYGTSVFEGMDLSPSQIESYLECPYQWFVKRRLKMETLDEGFGPMERGTFMHKVLEEFYRLFQQEVAPKVTPENRARAEIAMRRTFKKVAAAQPTLPLGKRYAPANAWEQKQLDDMLGLLLNYLDTEEILLPGFAPARFEWIFGTTNPFHYAGCNITGCIDRIDVDDEGNAVIIDYKSSLSNDYRLFDPKNPDEKFHLPHKMQALIYARVASDLLGLRVVGSLYIKPTDGTIMGAYFDPVVGPESIPFKTKSAAEACRVPFLHARDFEDLMDKSEATVAERISYLAQGNITPNPLSKEVCRYCPADICSKRLSPKEAR